MHIVNRTDTQIWAWFENRETAVASAEAEDAEGWGFVSLTRNGSGWLLHLKLFA